MYPLPSARPDDFKLYATIGSTTQKLMSGGDAPIWAIISWSKGVRAKLVDTTHRLAWASSQMLRKNYDRDCKGLMGRAEISARMQQGTRRQGEGSIQIFDSVRWEEGHTLCESHKNATNDVL